MASSKPCRQGPLLAIYDRSATNNRGITADHYEDSFLWETL